MTGRLGTGWAWLACLAVLVSACAPSPEERQAVEALRGGGSQAVSFDDIAYSPLAFPSRTAFTIDGSSPVMDIPPTGRSYVKGFVLPQPAVDMRVFVRSSFQDGGIFYPIITVLDERRQPIQSTELGAVRQGQGPLIGPIVYEAGMLLTGELRGRARFLVIHTTGNVQLSNGELVEPFMVAQRGPVFVPMPVHRAPPRPPRRAAIGSLVIELTAPIL